jgi:hypothetical protein
MNLTLKGPLLDGSGAAAMPGAIRMGIERTALHGAAAAQGELYPGHGVVRGSLRRAMYGRATGDLSGEVGNPLIYAWWIDTGMRTGRQTRFAGYHYMDAARAAIAAQDPSVVTGPIISVLNGTVMYTEGGDDSG